MVSIRKHISNIPGWRTNRHLIIFESDDWGSVRSPSAEAVNALKEGYSNDGDEIRYLLYDGLASANDLSSLFETLTEFRDFNGNHPVFTAFSLVANPDFERIKEGGFQKYFYEPFTESLKKHPDHKDSFKLWKEGIGMKIFIPEFHGREHLNVTAWMKALKTGHEGVVKAFNSGVFALSAAELTHNTTLHAAFNVSDISELTVLKSVIHEGLDLFESIMGYKARVFVAPNGWFNNQLENDLHEKGIEFIGASKIQKEPLGGGRIKNKFHYLGQKNKNGQVYLTRNCFFEPSSQLKHDWISACLSDIENSFLWKKPAVISTHRVNYIGFLNRDNRIKGLQQLRELLTIIIKKWPSAEFISSRDLGYIIKENR